MLARVGKKSRAGRENHIFGLTGPHAGIMDLEPKWIHYRSSQVIRPLRGLTVKSASGMPPTHFVDPFIVRGPSGVESLVSYGVRGAREA